VDITRKEHFQSDEGKNDCETDIEVGEEFDQAGDGKVEGTEAENGKGVGGQDDEGVAGDCKDGGDGIDRKNEVGGAESNQY